MAPFDDKNKAEHFWIIVYTYTLVARSFGWYWVGFRAAPAGGSDWALV